MSAKFSSKVAGIPELKRKFKALPDIAKEVYGEAGFETAKAVAARAKRRARVRFGILRDHLGASYSKRTGIAVAGIERTTVIVGDERISPGKYGHLQEFGTGPGSAHPFMRPAAEEERAAYVERIRAAKTRLEARVRQA